MVNVITCMLQACRPNTHSRNCGKCNDSRLLRTCHAVFCAIGCFSLALMRISNQPVCGAPNTATAAVEHMGINHGGPNILVAEEFLDRTNVVSVG